MGNSKKNCSRWTPPLPLTSDEPRRTSHRASAQLMTSQWKPSVNTQPKPLTSGGTRYWKLGGHEQSESGGKGLVLPIASKSGGRCPPDPIARSTHAIDLDLDFQSQASWVMTRTHKISS